MQNHVLLRFLVVLAVTAAAHADGPIRVGHGARHRPLPKTLVFYVHAAQPMARSNLLYFLEHGVHPGDGASYYFVLQSNFTTTSSCLAPFSVAPLSITEEFGVLPSNLPTNVRYVVHENDCYDLGTFGWFIQCGYADMTMYKYFIILNSSVRGPFLPAYVPWLHWAVVFIQFITDRVKLVGCTINCEFMPHVQTYLLATDAVGIGLMKRAGVFDCHTNRTAAIQSGELGASRSILQGGYQIASLQYDQQGVDWRNGFQDYCARNPRNPTLGPLEVPREKEYPGLHPFEVLFVKVKNDSKPIFSPYSGEVEGLHYSKVLGHP